MIGNYLIVDLEATCWEFESLFRRNEIIEISAVLLSGSTLQPISEFQQFVRHEDHPDLSLFCMNLTSIKDSAPVFPEAFELFINWISDSAFKLCSWGQFDYDIFIRECQRYDTSFPPNFVTYINLKEFFARAYSTKPNIGLREAMKKMKLPFEGVKHRGIDDARNITLVAQSILILDNE